MREGERASTGGNELPPRTLPEAFGLACGIALITSVPSALRIGRAGGSLVGGWLASAAVLLPLLCIVLALSRASSRGFRMLTGGEVSRTQVSLLALWIGLSTPLLLLLGMVLKTGTNHRGLGGTTFAVVGFFLVVGAGIVARRLVTLGTAMAQSGRNPTAIGAAFSALSILPTLVLSFPLLKTPDMSPAAQAVVAALVDGALVVVATALFMSLDLRPSYRAALRRVGYPGAAIVATVGTVWALMSPGLAAALRSGGGLSAALLSGLERWTDRDGDGQGAHFGGRDCDEGDPRRYPGAVDVPGDGIDQDCDGHDARPREVSEAPTPVVVTAPKVTKPDVVLVTLDTVGRAPTSLHGYVRDTTPNLVALGRKGVVFEHAYAAATETRRALIPLVSGRRFSSTARDRREWPSISDEVDTIAERMQRAGYATATVSSFTWVSAERGFAQGVDKFETSFSKEHPERGVTGPHAVQAVRQIVAGADTARPLFLWVHLFDAHGEYLEHAEHRFGKKKRDLYDGEVAFVDARLGEIVRAFEDAKRDPVFIVHGSHGEAFGEHGATGHGRDLFEEVLAVPLVIAGPGIVAGKVERAVSVMDVGPTVLELGSAPAEGISGVSLGPGLRGEPLVREPVYARTDKRAAVVDYPSKLIAFDRKGEDPRLLFFDLSSDPREERDASESRRADVERLQTLLRGFEASEAGGRAVAFSGR